MASIGVRQDTGKLYFNFRFRNVRCREQSDLKESPANRKRMQVALDKIQAEILLGQFDYASTFPNSQMLKKIDSIAKALTKIAYYDILARKMRSLKLPGIDPKHNIDR